MSRPRECSWLYGFESPAPVAATWAKSGIKRCEAILQTLRAAVKLPVAFHLIAARWNRPSSNCCAPAKMFHRWLRRPWRLLWDRKCLTDLTVLSNLLWMDLGAGYRTDSGCHYGCRGVGRLMYPVSRVTVASHRNPILDLGSFFFEAEIRRTRCVSVWDSLPRTVVSVE